MEHKNQSLNPVHPNPQLPHKSAPVATPPVPPAAKSEPKHAIPRDPKWDSSEPKVPRHKKGELPKVWVAVFKCTNENATDPSTGEKVVHKVKALNTTPANQVPCNKCGWPTVMMDMFKNPPTDYRSLRVREPDSSDYTDA